MELTEAINRKDYKEFGIFFNENFPAMVLFADKFVRDTDAAADIVQDAFLQLWHSEGKFDSMDKIRGFLYTTVHHLALNQLKHRQVVDRHVQETSDRALFRDAVLEAETYQQVHAAINRLAGQSRKIILLSLQGYSNQEIAGLLGVSINTVRTLKQNAYRKLRVMLKDNYILLFFYFL